MEPIKNPMKCEKDNEPFISLCETCNNKFLCKKCLSEHDFSHTIKSLQQIAIESVKKLESAKITDHEIGLMQNIEKQLENINEVLGKNKENKEKILQEITVFINKIYEENEKPVHEITSKLLEIKGKMQEELSKSQGMIDAKEKLKKSVIEQNYEDIMETTKSASIDIEGHNKMIKDIELDLRISDKIIKEYKEVKISSENIQKLLRSDQIEQKPSTVIPQNNEEIKANPSIIMNMNNGTVLAKKISNHLFIYDSTLKIAYAKPLPEILNTPADAFSELIQVKSLLYFIGGKPASNKTTSFNYRQNEWKAQKLCSLNIGRYLHSLAQIGNSFIYCIGGNNEQFLSTCERYDIAQNSWGIIPAKLKQNVGYLTCCVFNDHLIYAIGGYSSILGKTEQIEVLNAYKESEGWKIISMDYTMSGWSPRYWVGATQISKTQILIFGGCSNTSENSVYFLDVENRTLEKRKETLKEKGMFTCMTPPIIDLNGNLFSIDNKNNVHSVNILDGKWNWAIKSSIAMTKN